MDAKTFTGETHLEVECRFGLRGTPPTLDCLVDAPAVLAAESKCTETFSPDVARFSDAYDAAFASASKEWRAEYDRLVEYPTDIDTSMPPNFSSTTLASGRNSQIARSRSLTSTGSPRTHAK